MKKWTRLSLLAVMAVLAFLGTVAAVAWACVPSANLAVVPTSGAPGTPVELRGSGYPDGATATITWQNADGSNPQPLPPQTAQVQEAPFVINTAIPNSATPGDHLIEVRVAQGPNGFQAAIFTVTGSTPNPNPGGNNGGGSYRIPNPFTGGFIITRPGGPTGSCQGRVNTRVGTNGADVIVGTSAADVISSRGGNDVVRGRGGADRICAGSGRDNVSGGGGGDRLAGNSGRDRLSGGSGRDRLSGGSGRDRLLGGSGKDRLNGGAGKDRMNGGPGTDSCFSGPGDWATLNCE